MLVDSHGYVQSPRRSYPFIRHRLEDYECLTYCLSEAKAVIVA